LFAQSVLAALDRPTLAEFPQSITYLGLVLDALLISGVITLIVAEQGGPEQYLGPTSPSLGPEDKGEIIDRDVVFAAEQVGKRGCIGKAGLKAHWRVEGLRFPIGVEGGAILLHGYQRRTSALTL
jgi:hypothetical protein